MKLLSKEFLIDVIFIFLGCLIASLGINVFLSKAQLLSGGLTGIALIFQYLANINSGYVVFLLNLPLFVLSYLKLSKRFTLYSAVGMLSLSTSLVLTSKINIDLGQNDLLFYCIYGGVLCGIGYGLVFLRNASTGGTDIITMFIRQKYSNFDIGTLGFALNTIVVIIGAIFFGLNKALYTFVAIYIQGVILDKMIRGFSTKKVMLILTDKEKDIIDYVLKHMNRGITSLPAKGEYTHSEKKMLYCIVSVNQMIALKNKILSIDPTAFITIIDVSEVKGKGFVGL